jgi:hypothetical protein
MVGKILQPQLNEQPSTFLTENIFFSFLKHNASVVVVNAVVATLVTA